MIDHQKCQQLDQCSICCLWVDLNGSSEYAACPACPYRDDFIAQAASRRIGTATGTTPRDARFEAARMGSAAG